MKTLAVPPNVETLVIAYLETVLLSRGEDVTIGANIPSTWNPLAVSEGGSKPHILVAIDGTPSATYPITAATSVRVTAYASGSTKAQQLVNLCQGILLAHSGGGGISGIEFLTGVQPSQDNITAAQLATIAVRVNLRYSVLT